MRVVSEALLTRVGADINDAMAEVPRSGVESMQCHQYEGARNSSPGLQSEWVLKGKLSAVSMKLTPRIEKLTNL